MKSKSKSLMMHNIRRRVSFKNNDIVKNSEGVLMQVVVKQ